MASSSLSFSNPKDLKFVITLGIGNPNNFASGGVQYNTITLQGLKASVYIDNAGGFNLGTLRAQIFGVNQQDMNALTSTQWSFLAGELPNTIQVWAIDGTQETLVFNGIYLNGWGVYTSMPQVYMYIEGMVGYAQQMTAADPTSLSSDTTVSALMSNLAAQMGLQFVNNLTTEIAVKKGTYLGNTYMEQARTLMQMFNFWMYVDPTTNPATLAICNNGTPRSNVAPVISPQTGLIGYPLFNGTGILFESYFNPAILFGGSVSVQSSVPKANGSFIVTSLSHELSSVTPGGPWKTSANAVNPALFGGLAIP